MIAAWLLAAVTALPVSAAQTATAHRAVSTTVTEAQRHFDLGLTHLYAFDGGDASSEFHAAANADPSLAMAWWGVALAEGSDLNNPLTETRFQRAHEASIRAAALERSASPDERQLIDDVVQRYAATYSDHDRDERAYRSALSAFVETHPADDDAGMLFLEALLEDARPSPGESHQEKPDAQIGALLDRSLAHVPQTLMADHLCIHVYDAVANRTPAVDCARRLDAMTFSPFDEHLAHMPAHTWTEIGDWRAALASSERAYGLLSEWSATTGQDISASRYGRHDESVAMAAALIGMNRAAAAQWSQRLAKFNVSYDQVIAARFGDWTLALRKPSDNETYGWAAYGLAQAATSDFAGARATIDILRKAGLADQSDLIAASVDERQGNVDAAIADLTRYANEESDRFTGEYVPFFPPAERLGGVLLRAGRFAEAERAFASALATAPDAPRLLFGWWKALEGLGDPRASLVRLHYESSGAPGLTAADL